MSGAPGKLCSQNLLDNSVPFTAPNQYIITTTVIDQIKAIIDRDILAESEALQLYTITKEQRNKINETITEHRKRLNAATATKQQSIINQARSITPTQYPNIKAVYNTNRQYSSFHEQMKAMGINTFTKKGFLNYYNKATDFNRRELYSFGNTTKLVLDELEISALEGYTLRGDRMVNQFLRDGAATQTIKYTKILEEINRCYTEYSLGDFNKSCFIFFKILYNTVAKLKDSYHNTNKYIKVFRGVKEQYLSEDPTTAFYTRAFLSTSYDINVAERFGYNPQFKEFGFTEASKLGKYDINVFYIHPQCYYCNMEAITQFPNEKEILITPYCRYIFIKKNIFSIYKRGSRNDEPRTSLYTKYYYAIFPTDLDIPTNFEDFMAFRGTIRDKPSPISGEVTGEVVELNIPAAGGRRHTRRRKSKRRSTRKHARA
jgi:hypothetical protein